MTVVVDFALYGVRELKCRPCSIDAQSSAFNKPVALADLDDVRQRKISIQLTALRP